MTALPCEISFRSPMARDAQIIPFPKRPVVTRRQVDRPVGWTWTNRGVAVILVFWSLVFAIGLVVVITAFLAIPETPLLAGESAATTFGFLTSR